MRRSSFKELAEETLAQGNRELSMSLGVLARIENNNYELIAVQSNTGAFVSGEKYRLGNSFCRLMMEQEKPIATTEIYRNAPSPGHPRYRTLPFECYIGAPVFHRNKPWGTLNFSSMAQRDRPFSAIEIDLVNSLSEKLSNLLDARNAPDE